MQTSKNGFQAKIILWALPGESWSRNDVKDLIVKHFVRLRKTKSGALTVLFSHAKDLLKGLRVCFIDPVNQTIGLWEA